MAQNDIYPNPIINGKISIEDHFHKYLALAGLDANVMKHDPEMWVQYLEMKKCYYAAWSTLLIFMRDNVSTLEESQAIVCLEDMLDQSVEFFNEMWE